MRISSKGRLAIGVLVVAGVAALVIMWALNQGKLPTPPPEVTAAQTTSGSKNPKAGQPGQAAENEGQVAATTAAPEQTIPMPTEDENAPEQRTWEDKLDEILLGDGNEDVKSDKIIALMPYAPAEAQEELSQHLVNMTQDGHYEGTSNLLMNLNTSTNVQEILINDLLNRNNALKLNTLLRVLETPSHPMQQNAHDMLELFVQEDFGTNMAAWEKGVADWLKENDPPVDPAATPGAPGEQPAQQASAPAPDAPQPQ
jgi:hypothetical protein